MHNMATITTHCIVKNEENFVGYAIRSVVDFVDQILVFDTGSTDKTVEIIKNIVNEYPDKIVFEEKGPVDKVRHTQLRQEMLNRTTTDWFMILDGDEVWTERGMKEVFEVINTRPEIECIVAPYYLCVGDIYHTHARPVLNEILGRKGVFSPRVIRKNDVRWLGDYNEDTLVNDKGEPAFTKSNTAFLQNRYWHMTHLQRSSRDDEDYSSGGSRKGKRRETYFIIGKKIKESLPEAFDETARIKYTLSTMRSFINFFVLVFRKLS